jgi:hypothetical protein
VGFVASYLRDRSCARTNCSLLTNEFSVKVAALVVAKYLKINFIFFYKLHLNYNSYNIYTQYNRFFKYLYFTLYVAR